MATLYGLKCQVAWEKARCTARTDQAAAKSPFETLIYQQTRRHNHSRTREILMCVCSWVRGDEQRGALVVLQEESAWDWTLARAQRAGTVETGVCGCWLAPGKGRRACWSGCEQDGPMWKCWLRRNCSSGSTTGKAHSCSSRLTQPGGNHMYRQFNIQQFCVMPTQCICVLCGSENKQRLFPYTTSTDWFL